MRFSQIKSLTFRKFEFFIYRIFCAFSVTKPLKPLGELSLIFRNNKTVACSDNSSTIFRKQVGKPHELFPLEGQICVVRNK